MTKKRHSRRKKPLSDEISDTEGKDQHESVSVTISMLRSLYLHVLVAMRDGDYNSPSAYVSDLIRRHKHVNPLSSAHQTRGSATTQPEGSEDGRKIKRIAHDLIMGKNITRADWDRPEP